MVRYNGAIETPPVHVDPPARRRALPARLVERLHPAARELPGSLPVVRAQVLGGRAPFGVDLHSDSEHLRTFFQGNWAPRPPSVGADAAIVALQGAPADYGLPGDYEGHRVVGPDRDLLVVCSSEYYGNIKIAVRGLAAAHGDVSFLHGCALAIDGAGVVLAGASGAGKTTVAAALRRLVGDGWRVVNDDWGGADLGARRLRFTGETNLHMKYRSVRTIAPGLAPDPARYPTENYAGDPDDAHARLLVPPGDVFGGAVVTEAPWSGFVAIFRERGRPFQARRMDAGDVDRLEASQYSAFYDRNEHFLDGSRLLLTPADWAGTRAEFAGILSAVPSLLVSNTGDADEAALAIAGFLADG